MREWERCLIEMKAEKTCWVVLGWVESGWVGLGRVGSGWVGEEWWLEEDVDIDSKANTSSVARSVKTPLLVISLFFFWPKENKIL